MPDIHLKLMRNLIEISNTASSSGVETAGSLDEKIKQMASICRMWRHADGQFARFNEVRGKTTIEAIEETLARVGQRGKVLQQAPHSGFIPHFVEADRPSLWTSGSPQTSAKAVHRIWYIGI